MPGKQSAVAAGAPSLEKLPYQYRALFPVTQKYIYMDHASVSPIATPTRDAMIRLLSGVSGHGRRKFPEWEQMITATREAAARLVNAKAHQIAFLRNTSEALSVIANGFSWRAGDNIVSAAVEFPANIYPWARVAAAFGVELRLHEEGNGHIDLETLLGLVDERTRLLTISWVQFGTGQRLDLRRIGQFCRERGIFFVVDAVQGLGALQLDVERDCVDAFAGSAHKFLLGPKGIGLLYLSDDALAQVHPTVVGWTAMEGFRDYRVHPFNFREGALRFEGGTLNEVGICGLGQTINLFLQVGPSLIERYLLQLRQYLVESLERRGYHVLSSQRPGEASAILVCRHERYSAEEICSELESKNIIISARLDRLRIAPHFYNTREEVDALIEALPV